MAVERLPQPLEILNMQRAIHPLIVLETGECLRRRVDTESGLGRRSRDHVDGNEQNDGRGQQRGHKRRQTEPD